METGQDLKNSKEQEITSESAQRHNCGTIVERHLEDEQHRMRIQGHTQTDMECVDRIALEGRIT